MQNYMVKMTTNFAVLKLYLTIVLNLKVKKNYKYYKQQSNVIQITLAWLVFILTDYFN